MMGWGRACWVDAVIIRISHQLRALTLVPPDQKKIGLLSNFSAAARNPARAPRVQFEGRGCPKNYHNKQNQPVTAWRREKIAKILPFDKFLNLSYDSLTGRYQ
jgi:hypothetical protein